MKVQFSGIIEEIHEREYNGKLYTDLVIIRDDADKYGERIPLYPRCAVKEGAAVMTLSIKRSWDDARRRYDWRVNICEVKQ